MFPLIYYPKYLHSHSLPNDLHYTNQMDLGFFFHLNQKRASIHKNIEPEWAENKEHLKKQKQMRLDAQKINILLATILLGSLVILGFRFTSSYSGKENNSALVSYFISLLPLGWAVAALNHLTSDIAFSSKVTTLSLTAITLSLASIVITFQWIKNRNQLATPAPVLGLAGCTLFTSIISIATVTYTLYKYYPI